MANKKGKKGKTRKAPDAINPKPTKQAKKKIKKKDTRIHVKLGENIDCVYNGKEWNRLRINPDGKGWKRLQQNKNGKWVSSDGKWTLNDWDHAKRVSSITYADLTERYNGNALMEERVQNHKESLSNVCKGIRQSFNTKTNIIPPPLQPIVPNTSENQAITPPTTQAFVLQSPPSAITALMPS
eukprot:318361_1